MEPLFMSKEALERCPVPTRTEEVPEAKLSFGTALALWFSLNRYVFLLVAVVAVLLAGPRVLEAWIPWSRWLWIPAVPVGLWLLHFAVTILSRFPKKRRAVARGITRLHRKTFSEADLVKYCDDPCSRVVVTELLRRKGVSPAQRRRRVRELSEQARERSGQLVILDTTNNRLLTVEGSTVTQVPLNNQA